MSASAVPVLAHLGGTQALTTTPVVGDPLLVRPDVFLPGTEELAIGEIRVTVLGSGDPWIRRSQASGSLLIEVGNPERDFFFFDLGSGSLANFTALSLPVEATTKVFLSHLHADHIGDIPGLVGSLAKAGRVDPVEIWGGASEDPDLGLASFVEHMDKAMAWDTASVRGVRPTTGFAMTGHEIPFDRPETIYERNDVTISCYPAIHGLSGAVGYTVTYAGLKVVFSGDTRPCRHVVDAAAGADLLIHECFQSPAVYARHRPSSGHGGEHHPTRPHGPRPDGQDPRPDQASPSRRTSRCSTSPKTPWSPARRRSTRQRHPSTDPQRPAPHSTHYRLHPPGGPKQSSTCDATARDVHQRLTASSDRCGSCGSPARPEFSSSGWTGPARRTPQGRPAGPSRTGRACRTCSRWSCSRTPTRTRR